MRRNNMLKFVGRTSLNHNIYTDFTGSMKRIPRVASVTPNGNIIIITNPSPRSIKKLVWGCI